MKLTGAAILVSRGMKVLQAAPAAYPYRSAAEGFGDVSIYGYLNCHDCRQTLWLGKALHHGYRPFAFHIGSEEEPPHWARPQLNQVLWKFLADHTGHRIDVRLEHEQTDEMHGYQDIGGDTDQGISFGAYLAGWPGLAVGGSPDAEPPYGLS